MTGYELWLFLHLSATVVWIGGAVMGQVFGILTQRARKELVGLNERVLSRTPAGRWGAPDDLAGIAVFLASPASDFVTGTAIPVDGGYSALG